MPQRLTFLAGVALTFAAVSGIVALTTGGDRDWLTDADRDELADLVLTRTLAGDWAAGCVWEDQPRAVVVPPGEAVVERVKLASGRDATLTLVEGLGASGNFGAWERSGAFCWVPEW